jgi:fatty-acyl-CoA synthase
MTRSRCDDRLGESMNISRPLTFAEAVEQSAASSPGKLAIRLDKTGRTYGALIENGRRRARQLLGLGLERGDRFGILLPNCIESVELMLAASMSGLVAVPINTRFRGMELHHIVSHSEMKTLVTLGGIPGVTNFADTLGKGLPSLAGNIDPHNLQIAEAPALRTILTLDGEGAAPRAFLRLETLPEADVALAANDPRDPLLIMYTSGTTAKPKGCILPDGGMIDNIYAIIERIGVNANDVWWCPLPMFHVGGILFAGLLLTVGGTFISTAYFEPESALETIIELKPTIIYSLFPTITLQLMESPLFAKVDLSRVRYIFNLAPPDLQQRIQRAFHPASLMNAFGMTEAWGVIAYSHPDDGEEQRLNTCGGALPGWEIRIVDPETRTAVGVDEKGEIAVRGVGLFDGYLNDPAATQNQFTQDGFFLTGDAGKVDGLGMLHFFGRLKDQLKVGGENVSALEVESFLATHPAVQLAQVVGVSDDKYGEVVAAFVERKAGTAATEQDVITFCTGNIARFKVPRYVRFVEEWPMSATKIQKFRLKQELEQELATSRRQLKSAQ